MRCSSEELTHRLFILVGAQVLTQTKDQKMLNWVTPCSDVPSLVESMPKSLSQIVASYDSSSIFIVWSLIPFRPISLIWGHITELISANLERSFPKL
jgi:hypothetical protein